MARIENDVVGIKFDNQQFEQAVATTIASLEKLTNALDLKAAAAGFAGVTGAAQKVDISAVSAGIESVNLAFMAFRAIYETVFRNLTTMAMDAGGKIVKSLSIQGAMDGFREYEMKMGSIQTMMAGTGESLGTVNKYLEELNKYSDQTIYSFSDMTSNIGKFTNAGVGLKESVAAIKGVANVAALSGANAGEASRAMYNFGQAISSGYVKLIDWKSIELANMGTKEFKTQLLEAGVAAGTVKKNAKGMYTVLSKNATGGVMKTAISASKGFNDSLQYQWMTSKVLTGTLNKYSDATTDIGRRATKAATEVKTFSMMMDTTKEAVGSGWAMSAELFFGDKDEATKLWTSLAGAISSIIKPSTDARNEMLKFWNDNGGRAAIIAGLTNVFKSLKMILSPIGRAFKEAFPPITGKMLVDLSKKFEAFTKKLTPTVDEMHTVYEVFKGIFSAISLTVKAIKFVIGVFATLGTVVSDTVKQLFDFEFSFKGGVMAIFDFVTSMNDAADKTDFFGNALKKFREILVDIALNGGQALLDFFNKIGELASTIGEALAPIGSAIKGAFSGFTFDNVIASIQTLIAGFAVFSGSNFLKGFLGLGDRLTSSFENFAGIKPLIKGLTGVLGDMQTKLKAEALKQIAIAIAILAASMFVLSLIKPERLNASITAIGTLLAGVMVAMSQFDKVAGGKGSSIASAAASLILLATGIMILSTAVSILGKMKPEELMQGLRAVAALLFAIGIFSKIVETQKGMVGAGAGMLLFSTSLLILTKVLSVLGKMDPDELLQALRALGAIFLGIGVFSKIIDPAKMLAAGASMVGISIAIAIMAGALQILGSMSLEKLSQALIGMTVGLYAMVIAVNALPMDAAVKAAGLLIMAVAMGIVAGALMVLGSMSLDQLSVALVGLGVAMMIMVVTLNALADPMLLVGAATLLVVSFALTMLAGVMKVLGTMSLEQIGKALLAMSAAFLVIGIAGYAITAAVPGLIGFSFALLLMGTAILFAGAGVLLFASAIAVLASVLGTSSAVFTAFILSVAAALPTLAYALATAVGAFAIGLVDQAGAILASLVTLIGVVLAALIKMLPQLLVFLGMLIKGVVMLLVKNVPLIVTATLFLLDSILTAIADWLPSIMKSAADIMVAFIDGMSQYVDRIITAGANFIISLIEGIGKNLFRIIVAAMDTILKFINGLTKAIKVYAPQINKAMKGLMAAMVTAALDAVGLSKFASIGQAISDGIKSGVTKAWTSLLRKFDELIALLPQSVKDALGIRSPSKVFAKLGMWIVKGLVKGLVDTSSEATKAGTKVVLAAYSAMQSATDAANDILVGIQDPIIKPIIDLDGVRKGVGSISSMMAGAPAIQMAGAVGSRMSGQGSGTTAAPTDAAGNTYVNFEQNNYSPKPVNRLEVYRQTHNGLRQLKSAGVIK